MRPHNKIYGDLILQIEHADDPIEIRLEDVKRIAEAAFDTEWGRVDHWQFSLVERSFTDLENLIALIREVLPGWEYSLFWNSCQGNLVSLCDNDDQSSSQESFSSTGSTMCLAGMAAFCKACNCVLDRKRAEEERIRALHPEIEETA